MEYDSLQHPQIVEGTEFGESRLRPHSVKSNKAYSPKGIWGENGGFNFSTSSLSREVHGYG